ncbi:helix-turn-helix transcriptional regulator [Streptomyces sp. NPDC006649]|uniref:helix-turn-helix transcriptional regulator n=1 Tax=Streptomyces sp. NPDC006649 TaxID=3156896 RepID=UPI0033BED15C
MLGEPDVVRVSSERDEPWCADHWPSNPHHVVCFAVSGTSYGSVCGESVVLAPGGVLWAPPGTPLRLRAQRPGPCTVLRLRLTHDPFVDDFNGPFLLADRLWEAHSLLSQLSGELSDGSPVELRDERVRGLLTVLFTSVFRAAGRSEAPGLLSRSAQRLITELADRRIHERLRAVDLADAVDLSPDYFTRVFRRTFGMPPREWLMRRRIRHGAWALDISDQSITEIAHALGYLDPFLFSRQFKLTMGMSPQTYRRKQRLDGPPAGIRPGPAPRLPPFRGLRL